MDNLQLQSAYALYLPRSTIDVEDDPVLGFCLDSTEEGLLYAATRSGTVQCFEQHGKKVCSTFVIQPSEGCVSANK
jgi:hypothetical protein